MSPDYESDIMRARSHKCKKSAEGDVKEFIAHAALTAGTFCKFTAGSDIEVETCGLAENIVGIVMSDVLAGEGVHVQVDGFHWIIVGAASDLTAGDYVMSDAAGKAIEITCNDGNDSYVGGQIWTTPDADNDCVCLRINIYMECNTARA